MCQLIKINSLHYGSTSIFEWFNFTIHCSQPHRAVLISRCSKHTACTQSKVFCPLYSIGEAALHHNLEKLPFFIQPVNSMPWNLVLILDRTQFVVSGGATWGRCTVDGRRCSNRDVSVRCRWAWTDGGKFRVCRGVRGARVVPQNFNAPPNSSIIGCRKSIFCNLKKWI